jgi:hypothetical protein
MKPWPDSMLILDLWRSKLGHSRSARRKKTSSSAMDVMYQPQLCPFIPEVCPFPAMRRQIPQIPQLPRWICLMI